LFHAFQGRAKLDRKTEIEIADLVAEMPITRFIAAVRRRASSRQTKVSLI